VRETYVTFFDFASFVAMIWASTLQIQKHGYSGDLDFIILFVDILPLYAINLGVVSLFANSPFTFLAIWSCYCLWCILSIWMNEYPLFLSEKNVFDSINILTFRFSPYKNKNFLTYLVLIKIFNHYVWSLIVKYFFLYFLMKLCRNM